MLITHLPDVHYLCGFTGSNAVLMIFAGSREAVLMTDGRYTRQAKAEAAGTKVEIVDRAALSAASRCNPWARCRALGITASLD